MPGDDALDGAKRLREDSPRATYSHSHGIVRDGRRPSRHAPARSRSRVRAKPLGPVVAVDERLCVGPTAAAGSTVRTAREGQTRMRAFRLIMNNPARVRLFPLVTAMDQENRAPNLCPVAAYTLLDSSVTPESAAPVDSAGEEPAGGRYDYHHIECSRH